MINDIAVWIGSSITLGARTTPAVVTATQTFPYLICQHYGLTEVNKGVPGNTVAQMKARFETDVTAYNPAIVVIEASPNDWDAGIATPVANYEADIRWMIERTYEIGARPVLLVAPANTDTTTANKKLYLDAIREIPLSYPGIVIFDLHRLFAELQHFAGSLSTYLMDDYHPTVLGCSTIAAAAESIEHERGFLIATASPPGTWLAAAGPQIMNRFNLDWQNATIRQKVDAANVSNTGLTNVRVIFRAGNSALTLVNVFIGYNTTGYGFDVAPVRLTFSASNSVVIAANGSVTSDSVAFTIPSGKNLIVSMDTGSTNYRMAGKNDGSFVGWRAYWKQPAGADASNTSPSGYTTSSNYADCVTLIEAM